MECSEGIDDDTYAQLWLIVVKHPLFFYVTYNFESTLLNLIILFFILESIISV